MKLQKILFATDFSDTSKEALEIATWMAKANEASLLIVHVCEPPEALAGMNYQYTVPSTVAEEEQERLKTVAPVDPDVPFERHLLQGHAPHAIVDFAKDQNADMIVMGTHGHTGFGRLLMGSVAEHVVRSASCPVLTMRQSNSK